MRFSVAISNWPFFNVAAAVLPQNETGEQRWLSSLIQESLVAGGMMRGNILLPRAHVPRTFELYRGNLTRLSLTANIARSHCLPSRRLQGPGSTWGMGSKIGPPAARRKNYSAYCHCLSPHVSAARELRPGLLEKTVSKLPNNMFHF